MAPTTLIFGKADCRSFLLVSSLWKEIKNIQVMFLTFLSVQERKMLTQGLVW